jgi:hypothetical protein
MVVVLSGFRFCDVVCCQVRLVSACGEASEFAPRTPDTSSSFSVYTVLKIHFLQKLFFDSALVNHKIVDIARIDNK